MRILLSLLLAAGLPPIAVAQEFQYSNSWQMGYQPASFAGYSSGGYVVSDQVSYSPGAYSQPAYVTPGVEAAPYAASHETAPCCTENCEHCCASHCSTGRCLHRSGVFGEYLYWQVSGADVSYGVPQDGIGSVGTVPLGEVGVLDYDHEPAFRVGFNVALGCTSSVTTSYTTFETNANHELFTPAPFVIQPLVMVPGTFNAGFTGQLAFAESSLELDLLDVEYRGVLACGKCYHINGIVGARYAELDQSFSSVFFFAPPDGTTVVQTELDFEGVGLRFGVEGERFLLPHLGISGYGKLIGGVLGGEFSGTYLQANQLNGLEAYAGWEDARLVPTAEAELGLSWVNRSNSLRLSAGYYVGIWSNVVTTTEWINGVQALNFVDIGRDDYDTLRFDGLVARAELRL